ncbi:MAG: deoxyribose-phosphate aldolase [Kiritimatiellaeota bacterium]|nr:deoxyribose-phosphate aldolase [Kiritimatiellota bacterium]
MEIASCIDHTLLKPEATEDDIIKLCAEADEHSFAAVCVNPCRVPVAVKALANSDVKVCCVTGFPFGATSTFAKLQETRWCLENGADEIDTVMNIGEAKAGNWDYIENELREIADLAHGNNAILKVIFENCLLDSAEIAAACGAAVRAGVDFVKTSTGFSGGGATLEDVSLMSKAVSGACGVKAAGGVRKAANAIAMIEAGATRIGTSAGVLIISGGTSSGGY